MSVHPETIDFRMELSAISQHLVFNVLAESRKLMADSSNPKTSVFG